MSDDYRYIDPDYTYTDPRTGVLRNIAGATDHDALTFIEVVSTTKRTNELKANPIKAEGSSTLFAIHRHLFQDVYEWAGERRTVEISKGGKQFFPISHFDTALAYVDGLIAEYRRIDDADKRRLSRRLAEILDSVNFLHPFREGNGRTQREFLRLLALEKGWKLNLNPIDDAEAYKRYMDGTIDGDIDLLAATICEFMDKV
ncbi:MAG: Fic family protein [Candidatus Methanoplasma sp.]|jgi:cell filamentation protein|nr:Fic family protein [Candidatus Methanoplasma sp.]